MPSLVREEELLRGLWELVREHLPPKPSHPKGGRPFTDDFPCFVGIVFILRNGARWQSLDKFPHAPSSATCWRRHRDWTRAGVWNKVWAAVLDKLNEAGKIDWEEVFADATFVEAQKGGRRLEIPSAARG